MAVICNATSYRKGRLVRIVGALVEGHDFIRAFSHDGNTEAVYLTRLNVSLLPRRRYFVVANKSQEITALIRYITLTHTKFTFSQLIDNRKERNTFLV